jgi:hypothetical protein
MVETSWAAGSAPTAAQTIAGLAGHARLPSGRARELLGNQDLARLVGTLLADADAVAHRDEVVGACLSRRAVGELLGGISRQAVAQRDGGDLLAVCPGGRRATRLYPAFQFDGSRPLEGLAEVLGVLCPADPAGDRWAVAVWLRTPNVACGGITPEHGLREGRLEQVWAAAVAQAKEWAETGMP